jgi:hypothetical protein
VRETICDASQDTAYVTVSESIIYQCLFMMLKLYLGERSNIYTRPHTNVGACTIWRGCESGCPVAKTYFLLFFLC